MGYGLKRVRPEAGSGGKRGHSGIDHWGYTDEVKEFARKARRRADRVTTRIRRTEQATPPGSLKPQNLAR